MTPARRTERAALVVHGHFTREIGNWHTLFFEVVRELASELNVPVRQPVPESFIDVYFGRATVENFIDMLRQLPPGLSEVAVHPAIVDDRLRELDAEYGEPRADELAVLLDPGVREAFALYDVQPVDFAFLQDW